MMQRLLSTAREKASPKPSPLQTSQQHDSLEEIPLLQLTPTDSSNNSSPEQSPHSNDQGFFKSPTLVKRRKRAHSDSYLITHAKHHPQAELGITPKPQANSQIETIPILPSQTDKLSFKERHAKKFLDWQYLAAYLGLGAFGRRALTTSLLIVGVATALSGGGLAAVVIFTFILMAIDISYISLYGHKDRYTITRNEVKLYQLQVEQWVKEKKAQENLKKEEADRLSNTEKLIVDLKAKKEAHRIVVQDLFKIKQLAKDLKSFKRPLPEINAELSAIIKRQAPDYLNTNTPNAQMMEQITAIIQKNLEKTRAELKKEENKLCIEGEKLKQERLKAKLYDHIADIHHEIRSKTRAKAKPYFSALRQSERKILGDTEGKTRIHALIMDDVLIRRLMVECKIDANRFAKEYLNNQKTLDILLFEHFFRMSAVYENENPKIHYYNRKLVFGQFVKVGFRGLSLSLVLAYIFDSMGVISLASSQFLMIGLLGAAVGLFLGFGNSFAQRNKDELNQKYTDDIDHFKEAERRDKLVCLTQVLDAKLHYLPTQSIPPSPRKQSKEVTRLKLLMCFKVIPIFLLLGSLSRRPLTLLKLMPYSRIFRDLFPIAMILTAIIGLLIYDLFLSLSYIHRQRHFLNMHELSQPFMENEKTQAAMDAVVDQKIIEKLDTLREIKIKTGTINTVDLKTPLTTIIGDGEVAEKILQYIINNKSICATAEYEQILLSYFGADPKLPEQYRDYYETRDDMLETLEDLQVMKPTFRGMSVGGSFPNLFTDIDLTTVTLTTLFVGMGMSTAYNIPLPLGLALGFIIGLGLGIWMHRIDRRQEALQKRNLNAPTVFHPTDIRKKLNDALDIIILNQPKAATSLSAATYKPFTPKAAGRVTYRDLDDDTTQYRLGSDTQPSALQGSY